MHSAIRFCGLRTGNADPGGPLPLWLGAMLAFAGLALLAPHALGGDGDGSKSELAALERSFQSVVAQVSPCVVSLHVRRRTIIPAELSSGGGGPIEQLVLVNGSGTIIREDGCILTNEHVIHGAAQIDVSLFDGRELSARVLAADPRSDLAILHVPCTGLTAAAMCDWERVARGQWAVALGNPFGLGGDGKVSVSVGVISNLDRRLPGLGEADDRLYCDMIQTTATINPGNSGGPLFNLQGQLVGVVTAMHTRTASDDGVGFAIPMTPAKRRLVDRLLRGESIEYGYLGMTVRAPDAAERQTLGAEAAGGVYVERVDPQGPAARAGVAAGDVVVRLDDQPVHSSTQLVELVGGATPGQDVSLTLFRQKRQVTVRVRVEARHVGRTVVGHGQRDLVHDGHPDEGL